MPVRSCRSGGKPGYKYGQSGKCYTYTAGDASSRKKAKSKAAKQGRAIEASKNNILQKFNIAAFFSNHRSPNSDQMDNQPILFITHDVDVSERRIEIFNGKEHLVIPCVAAIEGVLNKAFLPISSLEASLPAWEGVSVTMAHPKQYGQEVSANTKFAQEEFVVGKFFNVSIDGIKFKGEFWICLESLENHERGSIFLQKIEDGETIEVSTAYWAKISDNAGVYKGKSYNGIQYDLVPNHVAILVDEIGACSVSDGCGAPRTNKEINVDEENEEVTNCAERGENLLSKLKQKLGEGVLDSIESNRLSFGDIQDSIRTQISQDERADTFIWIIDIWDNEVVFGREFANGEVDLVSRSYSIGASPEYEVTLGDAVEVERVVSYKPVSNSEEETVDMDRDNLIEQLATNDAVPFDKDQLQKLDDATLNKWKKYLEFNDSATSSDDDPPAPAATPPAAPAPAAAPPEPAPVTNALTKDVADALNKLGATGIEQIINSAKHLQEQRQQEHNALVSRLVANERCTVPEKSLRSMDLETLQSVARMAVGSNYSGAGGPATMFENSEGPPPPPRCVLPDDA